MSWTLFIQLFLLILLIGCIWLAVTKERKPEFQPLTKAEPAKRKPMRYVMVNRPYDHGQLEDGDFWVNPGNYNEVRVWSGFQNDWVLVEQP